MLTLEVIGVCYKQELELKQFAYNWLLQTNKDFKVHIIHDGPPESHWYGQRVFEPRLEYYFTDIRQNNWGHSSRKFGITKLGDSKYTLITNVDDVFAPVFIEEMCSGNEDLVTSEMGHHHWKYMSRPTSLKRGCVDISCCVVKTDIVREVGWNHFSYAADWFFLQEILTKYPNLTKRHVPKILLLKN